MNNQDNQNNQNNQNNDNKEESKKINIINHNPTTIFKLPITFVEKTKLHVLDEHILTDLELTECTNADSANNDNTDKNDNKTTDKLENSEEHIPQTKTMYDHIFNPKTIYGKHFLSNWATHYTSDVTFLKQTQTLIQQFTPLQSSKDEEVD